MTVTDYNKTTIVVLQSQSTCFQGELPYKSDWDVLRLAYGYKFRILVSLLDVLVGVGTESKHFLLPIKA